MDKTTAEKILLWWEEVKESRCREGYQIWDKEGLDQWAYLDKPAFVTEAERICYVQ